MKVKLHMGEVFKNIQTEKELADQSIMESFYAIRRLKALAESLNNGSIDVVDKTNACNQVYSVKYEIWFSSNEFELI